MTAIEKLKEYRILSGISTAELMQYGKYPKSVQAYRNLERGDVKEVTEQHLIEAYGAINLARCEKRKDEKNKKG